MSSHLLPLTIRLTLEGGATHSRIVSPVQPTNERQIWLKLLHLELKLILRRQRFSLLCSKPSQATPARYNWACSLPQLLEPSRLDVTLARIRALVGDGNVGTSCSEDTNQMDGFVIEPFRIPKCSAYRDCEEPASGRQYECYAPGEATFTSPSRASAQNHSPSENIAIQWSMRMVHG